MLRGFLRPIVKAHADTVVLACTHYPFVIEPIRRIVGPGVNVIDPSPAIARQAGRALAERGLSAPELHPARHAFLTTGDRHAFRRVLTRLVGVDNPVGIAAWQDEDIASEAA